MCGICGIYNFNNNSISETKLEQMTKQLIHRDPDDAGFLFRNSLGLAMDLTKL